MTFIDLPIPPRKYVEIPEAFRKKRVQSGRFKVEIELPAVVRQPLVVSFGMGVDSTAMLLLLIKMVERGNRDAMPDRIYFADVGSEKPRTEAYIAKAQAYLKAAGFPEITVVSKGARGNSLDRSLHESCERLEMLPSLAYGGKSCSCKWKIAEMDMSTNQWLSAQQAWAAGLTVLKLIGYDGGKADMRRSTNPGDDKYTYCYPLRDAKLQRPDLEAIIAEGGWESPGKSACFHCPASKRYELLELFNAAPWLLARALRIEAAAMLKSARTGKKMSTKGLGRNWAWKSHLETTSPDVLDILRIRYDDIGDANWQAYQDILAKNKELEATGLTEPTTETCDDYSSTEPDPAVEDEEAAV